MKEVAVLNHASVLVMGIRRQMSKAEMGTLVWGALLAGAVLIASSSPAMAQAGKLDPTFGVRGVFYRQRRRI
jgi:hypothetical protein